MNTLIKIEPSFKFNVGCRLNAPFPLTFSCISATICTPGVNSEFKIKELDNTPVIIFKPDEIKTFSIEFVPDPNDVEKEIQAS